VNELESISQDFKSNEEELKPRMSAIKYAILSEQETFIEAFVQLDGVTKLITLLRHPKNQLVTIALDIIPKLLTVDVALQFMQKKPDLFTNLYEKMDSQNQRIRYQTHMVFVWLC